MINYLDQAKEEIRKMWFKNHIIKHIDGNEGFQRISWGKKATREYQIDYVLSGNMVFVTGDLGDAVYSLTCEATLDNIKKFNLSYFTGKLTAHQRERWDFDDKLAREQIEKEFLSICDVDNTDDLKEEDKELFKQLRLATREWGDYKAFESMGVWSIYRDTDVKWFDAELASSFADCGKRLAYPFIAYWVGLQMIIEQISK